MGEAKHAIPKDIKSHLYDAFKSIMYTTDQSDVSVDAVKAKIDQIINIPPNFLRYVESLMEDKDQWALSYRTPLMHRGQNTNNVCEASMKVFKDKVFLIIIA